MFWAAFEINFSPVLVLSLLPHLSWIAMKCCPTTVSVKTPKYHRLDKNSKVLLRTQSIVSRHYSNATLA